MIYFDVCINYDTIDTIAAQRVETNNSGVHRYLIRHPKGYEHDSIFHQYKDGYFPLMCKIVDVLKKGGYKPVLKKESEECDRLRLLTELMTTDTLATCESK